MIETSRSPSQALQDHVGAVVGRLQAGYLADAPAAIANLARLRRAITSSPGADPTVWALMFMQWPPELTTTSDGPSNAENAAHAALTLFAVHQQSKRRDRMHQFGRSLGQAVGDLARWAGPNDVAVRRRFDALVTASELREILHHGRGLVTQLRSASVSLDYGLFAKHLLWLQSPGYADRVRLRWARDYYARDANQSAAPTSLEISDPEPDQPEGESA